MYDALRRQCISANVKFHNEDGAGRLNTLNNSITEPMFNSAQGLSLVNTSFLFNFIILCFTIFFVCHLLDDTCLSHVLVSLFEVSYAGSIMQCTVENFT